jgi:hypothetical protein
MILIKAKMCQCLEEAILRTVSIFFVVMLCLGAPRLLANEYASREQIDLFKRRVFEGDVRAVLANTRYPLLVIEKNGRRKHIRNAKSLGLQYQKIFDIELKRAIRCIDLDDVFENSQGVMIGNGTVWFDYQDSKENLILMTVNKRAANTVRCPS